MFSDLHIHTSFSADATDDAEQYVTEAIKRGINTIGFSDHYDFSSDGRSFGYYDYDRIEGMIKYLKSKFVDDIEILFGVELGYSATLASEISQAFHNLGFDYIIGSVHHVAGITLSEKGCLDSLNKIDAPEIYGEYFTVLLEMIESGIMDIVGHFDLCKRYAVKLYGQFDISQVPDNLIERCLSSIIDNELSLEINSAGYRQFPGEPYPGSAVLEMYRDMGGKLITVGSDAHIVQDVGRGIDTAMNLAASLGFTEIQIYSQRQRIGHKIEK